MNQAWKTTTIGKTVDKYVFNYDDAKNEWHAGGSAGQKAVKFADGISKLTN